MRWNQGRAVIDQMLEDDELERVPAVREHADFLIEQARRHVESARIICESDPDGAYTLLYDGARKSLVAILENQGLRPTRSGGHLAAYHAVRAQLDPPMGKIVRPFNLMRTQRNRTEYPTRHDAAVRTSDVIEDLKTAIAVIDLAEKVLEEMSPF